MRIDSRHFSFSHILFLPFPDGTFAYSPHMRERERGGTFSPLKRERRRRRTKQDETNKQLLMLQMVTSTWYVIALTSSIFAEATMQEVLGRPTHPTHRPREVAGREKSLPNQQQRTLNELPTELRCRNFDYKHRLSIQIDVQTCKNVCAMRTYSN